MAICLKPDLPGLAVGAPLPCSIPQQKRLWLRSGRRPEIEISKIPYRLYGGRSRQFQGQGTLAFPGGTLVDRLADGSRQTRYGAPRGCWAAKRDHGVEYYISLPHLPISTPAADRIPAPAQISSLGVFVGYMLLDAWTANQDRHHENWAAITGAKGVELAPTFDHGSALARNLTDVPNGTIA